MQSFPRHNFHLAKLYTFLGAIILKKFKWKILVATILLGATIRDEVYNKNTVYYGKLAEQNASHGPEMPPTALVYIQRYNSGPGLTTRTKKCITYK